ncbi:MAG: class I tRNA ligase family protein, partial [Gammaproteobacteria bacterium]
AQAIYEFVWDQYCDWYLELSKPILNQSGDSAALRGTRRTLVRVLEAILRLAHPLMPFITEEIWQRVAPLAGVQGETIMLQPYPLPEESKIDREAEAEIGWLQAFLLGIRRIRGEMNIGPSHRLVVKLAGASATDRERIERHRAYLERLAMLAEISEVESASSVRGAATALVGDMQILVPLAGLIDIGAERERLAKQLERASADLEKCRRKLDNASFVANAPADVVAKERERVADLEQRTARLKRQIDLLAELD